MSEGGTIIDTHGNRRYLKTIPSWARIMIRTLQAQLEEAQGALDMVEEVAGGSDIKIKITVEGADVVSG